MTSFISIFSSTNFNSTSFRFFLALYSVYGFASAATIKTITDDDINDIEMFMKTKYASKLAEKSKTDIDYELLFGEMHASNPEQFELSGGEKRLIQIIASHVKKTVDLNGVENSNMSHFACGMKKTSKIERFLAFKKPNELHENAFNLEDLESKFFETVKRLLTKFVSGEMIAALFDHKMVSVTLDSNKQLKGTVFCILCKAKKKSKELSVSSRKTSNKIYWNTDNVKKHIRRDLSMEKKNVKVLFSKPNAPTDFEESQMPDLDVKSYDTDFLETIEIKKENESQWESLLGEYDDDEDDNGDSKTLSLVIEPPPMKRPKFKNSELSEFRRNYVPTTRRLG